MISTITTSTITTVTTMIGFGVAVSIVTVITLLAFLSSKELAAASINKKHRFLAKSLDVAIVPLLVSFVLITVVKIAEVLN